MTAPRSTAVQQAGAAAALRIANDGPAKGPPPEIADTDAAAGARMAQGMTALNGQAFPNGVQYTYNAKSALQQATGILRTSMAVAIQRARQTPEMKQMSDDDIRSMLQPLYDGAAAAMSQSPIKQWNDDYYQGYANPEFFTRTGFMTWQLKPGKSASAAVKAWLAGLTIGECNSTMCALELDSARALLGDAVFDHAFNTLPGKPPSLVIGPSSPIKSTILKATAPAVTHAAGVMGHRPAQIGEWYYFCNHPKYLLKHPGGAWQGENALLVSNDQGGQLWSGLGADSMSEDAMMDEMVQAYNQPRDDDDQRALSQWGGTLPPQLEPKSQAFPDTITKADILSAPPFAWLGKTRTGGFQIDVGLMLDRTALHELAGS